MTAHTKIEWADHTFNPWIGCTKVSPGCDHCYAEALATNRLGVAWGQHAERRRTAESTWRQPLTWNRRAEREGRRYRVFCASLADVFDNQVPGEWRQDLWRLIEATPHLDWLLLTKRPQNICTMLPDATMVAWNAWPWPHVWLGTTAENQAEADRRIPHLLRVPAAKRFLSCEPLLGPVDLSGWLPGDNGCQSCDDGEGYGNRCSSSDIPREEQCPWTRAVQRVVEHGPLDDQGIPFTVTCHVETLAWVISGGESGPGARPSHPDWHRSLRDQCAAADVPFLFKQWGEWLPGAQYTDDLRSRDQEAFSRYACKDWDHDRERWETADGRLGDELSGDEVYRVGKKLAGRLLDGVLHDGVPA